MEGDHSNDFNYKSRFSYSENTFSRDGTVSNKDNWFHQTPMKHRRERSRDGTFSNNDNRLLDTPMERRRDNRKRSREGTLPDESSWLFETPMEHGRENLERSRESELNRDRLFYSENSERGRHGDWNHDKNLERGGDGEWVRDMPLYGNSTDNFGDIDIREQYPQQSLQQPSNFSAFGYNTSDPSYVDNRRALSMISACKVIAAITSKLETNPIDNMPMAQSNLPVNAGSSAMRMPSDIDMAQPSGSRMNSSTYTDMPRSNMSGMVERGNYCQYGMIKGQKNVMVGPMKEIIQLTKCILYPPSQNTPPREKPLGCKTVFVGGLSEKVSEEMIREIFIRCGEIIAILMTKENFCHIRFANESYAEKAMYFSGYKIKIEEDDNFIGELHLDYAKAREDEYEYECQQRVLQFDARRKERLEQKYFNTPTPLPTVRYSDHDSGVVSEKLRGEETFQQAVTVLITWLERGECSKRNAGSFFSMIQSTNSHVKRLMNEKLKFEDELEKAKNMLQKNMHRILLQFNNIEKVFNAACLQKVWDHFTKAQRKNIEIWKKQTEEVKNAHVEKVLKDRIEDEMDLCDDDNKQENNAAKKVLDGFDAEKNRSDEVCKLQEEIAALRCQLEAAENKVIVVQSEKVQELDSKDHQIESLKQILQSSKNEMTSQTRSLAEAELNEFRTYKSKGLDKNDEKDGNENSGLDTDSLGAVVSTSSFSKLSHCMSFNENEARLIGLISAFLTVHPFGANLDYICSYLHQIDSTIKVNDVENVMKSLSAMFREDSTGVGASLGKKWHFLGFQS